MPHRPWTEDLRLIVSRARRRLVFALISALLIVRILPRRRLEDALEKTLYTSYASAERVYAFHKLDVISSIRTRDKHSRRACSSLRVIPVAFFSFSERQRLLPREFIEIPDEREWRTLSTVESRNPNLRGKKERESSYDSFFISRARSTRWSLSLRNSLGSNPDRRPSFK